LNGILISIITPFEGKTECIERMLESLDKALSRDDIRSQVEVIIVSSQQITNIKLPRLNIKIVKCARNTEVGEARNIGVNFSRGSYIYFIDSDCIIPSPFFLKFY